MSDPTYGLTAFTYDALGRTTRVTQADGSAVTTAYSGNCVTVTDEQSKNRQSCSDGLGRLTSVVEDPGGLGYLTTYSYDALGNLLSVLQNGSRQRSFAYDSLSRLTSSTNPESNTTASGTTVSTTYMYDSDGNLSQKTMPAQNQSGSATVTLTYCYDALNRLTAKGYTAQTCSNGTMPSPVASYSYDQTSYYGLSITNGIGRRTGMSDAAGSEAWSYDVMGRALADQRTTNSVTKTFTYTYNLDGTLASLGYPSGRTITYAPNAASQPVSAVDNPNNINYATGAHYTAWGALAALQNGGTVTATYIFNNRLQPCWIYATTGTALPWNSTACTGSATTGTTLDLKYNFNLGSADNGNVMGITNNRDTTRSQSFSYDSLNRIATAQTSSTSGSTCWGEQYGYDAWANLLSISAPSGYSACTEEYLNLGVNASNRITNPGVSYDTPGNELGDGINSYSYDAENHLTAAAGVTYTYDGDGNRVQKSNGKLYWYGAGSDPLDETDLSGNLTSEFVFFGGKRIAKLLLPAGTVDYYFADHLGTSRIVTNSSGTVLDDSDFYPFGGERPILSSSGNTYKFTGKERDTESGLDNFGARYDASSFGRFMTADPKPIGVHALDPQTLNRYAYTRNNPLAYVDPDGRDLEKAWNDIKTFANSIYVKVSIGFGAELKAKRGPVEAKVGAAYKANAETSQDAILKISRSAEAGASAGTENQTVYGKSVSVEQTVLTLQNDMHLTGEEPPVVKTGDKAGVANASEDKLGIGLEGGVILVGGGEVGATREGLNALKDAVSEVKASLASPGPPPAPKPPQPPLCAADNRQKCN